MSSAQSNVFKASTKLSVLHVEPLSHIWQIAWVLLLIVGLVVALGMLARRIKGGIGSRNTSTIKIIDNVYLGPKERLVLVRLKHTEVLIGIAGQGMTPLISRDAQSFDELLVSNEAAPSSGAAKDERCA